MLQLPFAVGNFTSILETSPIGFCTGDLGPSHSLVFCFFPRFYSFPGGAGGPFKARFGGAQKGICRRRRCAAGWFKLGGIYIWAVNAGHVVDVSLGGYYINPLLSVCLGMLILQERLGRSQAIAVVLALAGVAIITIEYGGAVPWVALSLAITFGLYGLVKKSGRYRFRCRPRLGNTILAPSRPCLPGLSLYTGQSIFFGGTSLTTNLLLAGAGPATALPLIWFGRATQRIPLSTVGFIHYLTPPP